MTMNSTEAASHPAHQKMGEVGKCLQVLASPSNMAMEHNNDILFPESPYSECPAGQPDQFAFATFHIDPHLEGPPRYLLLSTFLI